MTVADRAAAYDAKKANLAWTAWICDGPAMSARRLHHMTRVMTGWIPSALQHPPDEDVDVDAALEFEFPISEQSVKQSEIVLLTSQAEVDMLAKQWGGEWAAGSVAPIVEWLAGLDQSSLPAMTAGSSRCCELISCWHWAGLG